MKQNTFCPIPWIFQAARSNGDVRICCQANITKNQGVVRKPDGTAYNAGIDDLNEARNAELMKNVRLNMLNGVWSDECKRCQNEEQNNLSSRRQYEALNWPKFTLENAKNITSDTGEIDTNNNPVKYYDLRFGNFCNLKCRMCGPTDSDSWYEDWEKLTGKTTYKETSGEVQIYQKGNKLVSDAYNWVYSDSFWDQLYRNVQNIEHVYFAGGEPMLIDRHYAFLEYCIEKDAAKNMIVEYNTNMSTMPPRVIDLWSKFKQVRVGASIDGMDKVLEYQRHPAKWNKLLKNLQILDNTPPNIMAWMAFTVTAYNVNHMIDFMKWKLTQSDFKKINSFKGKPIITYHMAHNPKHLNIRVLPKDLKQQVTKNFDDFIDWINETTLPDNTKKKAMGIRNSVVSYMTSESYYDEHWEYFKTYTKTLDKIRAESLLEVEPIFKDYI
jgi:organic radical activating enzyme